MEGEPRERRMSMGSAGEVSAVTISKEGRREQYRKMLDGENSGVFHVILAAILFGTAVTIVETMPEMRNHIVLFQFLDTVIAIFFSAELLLRFYVSSSYLEFFTNCFNIIDILAVVPNYVSWMMMLSHLEAHNIHQAADSMRALRMTRIIRLVRLARMARVARLVKEWHALSQMELLLKVFVEETAHGNGATSLMLLGLISLTFACLIYVADEPDCQSAQDASSWMVSDLDLPMDPCEDTFIFNSLPSSWWWAVETLTTVGFGDVMPTASLAKFLSALCCVCGVAFLSHFSAQFSMHFCQRWLRLQATHKMKEQMDEGDTTSVVGVAGGRPNGSKELERLDELLLAFEESLTELVDEVALAAVAGHKGCNIMLALTRSIEAHGHILNSGICAFLHEALTAAMSTPKLDGDDGEARDEAEESIKSDSELPHMREDVATVEHPSLLQAEDLEAPGDMSQGEASLLKQEVDEIFNE